MKQHTKWLATAGLSTALLLGACSAEPVASPTRDSADSIAFSVGDFEMSEAEFTALMINQPMGGGYTYGERILEQEIVRQVLELEFGDRVTDEMVDEELETMVAMYGGQESYEQYLEDEGLTDEQIRLETRNSLLFDEALFDAYPIDDEALKAMYDEEIPTGVRVAHILVEDEEKALAIIAELEEGADFAELVQEYSLDEASLEDDGEYVIIAGQMDTAFEEASLALEEGEVTQTPVESIHGFHVIQSLYAGEKASFEDRVDELTDLYYNQLFENGDPIYEQIIYGLIEEHEASITVALPDLTDVISKLLADKPADFSDGDAYYEEDAGYFAPSDSEEDQYMFTVEDLEDLEELGVYEDSDVTEEDIDSSDDAEANDASSTENDTDADD